MRTTSEKDRRESNGSLVTHEYFLKPGYVLANREDTIVRAVLGNAVIVTLYDRKNNFGGISHYFLPVIYDRARSTPQYGNVAVTALCRLIADLGGKRGSLAAQIIGGGKSLEREDNGLGMHNVDIARRVLRKFGVPVVSEDVGGSLGRKVVYHSGSNETLIYKVERIRASDWFEPDQDIMYN